MTRTHKLLERRIRAYLKKHGSVSAKDVADEPSKVVRQVLRGMPDLKLIGKMQVKYNCCSKKYVNVWGFK